MTAPGVNILNRDTPTAKSAPVSVSRGFMVGVTQGGPLEPFLVRSPLEYVNKAGPWSSLTANAYNTMEAFFSEGGSELMVSRSVGSGAAVASKNLVDDTAVSSLRVKAPGPGEYYNSFRTAVIVSGGSFKIQYLDAADDLIEETPLFADKTAALQWAPQARNFVLEDGASTGDPVALASSALTGGLLNAAGVTDVERQAALDKFTADLGPGQVCMPGATTDPQHVMLDLHAENNTRIAIKDGPNTVVVATLTASSAASRSRFGGMFAPWPIIPGLVTAPRNLRTIPPCGIIMGILARNDALGKSPSTPAAGINGISRLAVGLSQPKWSDADRATLNESGVNVLRAMYGDIRNYGWRTTVDATTDSKWRALGPSRLHRAISARAGAVADRFVFREIDGEQRTQSDFAGQLAGEALMPFYLQGSLYGATPEEAFAVDTGPLVNTPETIENDELRAVIDFVPSGMAESITIELVRRLITEGVS